MSASNEELARRAADPTSGWETLQQIVADHPELRAEVAANPAAYPELLDWLAELGDADVDAALAARDRSAGTNTTEALDVRGARDGSGTRGTASSGPGTGDGTSGPGPGDGTSGPLPGDGTSGEPSAATGAAAAAPAFPPSGPAAPPTGGPTRLSVRDRMTPNASTWSHAPATRGPWTEHAASGPAAAAGAASAATHAPSGAGAGDGAGAGAGTLPPAGSSVFTGDGSPAERRRPPIALLAVALVVVLLAIFAVTQLIGRDGTDTAAGEPAPGAGTSAAGEPAEPTESGPSTDPTPTSPADLVRPAPQDAVQAASFSSPSSNIVCALADEGLRCTILEHDFDGPDGCVGGPTTISLDADGDVSQSCAGGSVSTASLTLEYGASATFGSGACTSTPDGMSCWDMRTGNGFTVARAGVSEG